MFSDGICDFVDNKFDLLVKIHFDLKKFAPISPNSSMLGISLAKTRPSILITPCMLLPFLLLTF